MWTLFLHLLLPSEPISVPFSATCSLKLKPNLIRHLKLWIGSCNRDSKELSTHSDRSIISSDRSFLFELTSKKMSYDCNLCVFFLIISNRNIPLTLLTIMSSSAVRSLICEAHIAVGFEFQMFLFTILDTQQMKLAIQHKGHLLDLVSISNTLNRNTEEPKAGLIIMWMKSRKWLRMKRSYLMVMRILVMYEQIVIWTLVKRKCIPIT